MADQHAARLDFGQLLAAVEDAPPVAAVDVLGERLVQALGAREVSFLIADFSGRALIRLGHAASVDATRAQGRETADDRSGACRVLQETIPTYGRSGSDQGVDRAARRQGGGDQGR